MELVNYYDPGGKTVTIPGPGAPGESEGAELLLKICQWPRKGQTRIAAELEKTREELAYLESLESSIQNDLDLEELLAVEEEMQEGRLGQRPP